MSSNTKTYGSRPNLCLYSVHYGLGYRLYTPSTVMVPYDNYLISEQSVCLNAFNIDVTMDAMIIMDDQD